MTVECEICEKGIQNKQALLVHKKWKHNGKAKLYEETDIVVEHVEIEPRRRWDNTPKAIPEAKLLKQQEATGKLQESSNKKLQENSINKVTKQEDKGLWRSLMDYDLLDFFR